MIKNTIAVTAKVPKRADMERFSTMAALDMQGSIVAPVFERIYVSIFDTEKPIRETVLSGIQLTEKKGKKNEEQQATSTESEQ